MLNEKSKYIFIGQDKFFQNSKQWVKKGSNEDFDVSKGCYDGEKIFELVGILFSTN